MNCTTLYVLCETLSAKEETGLAIPLNVRIKRERGKAEKICWWFPLLNLVSFMTRRRRREVGRIMLEFKCNRPYLFALVCFPLLVRHCRHPVSGIRSSPDAAQLKLSKINNHVIGVLQKSDPPHCSIMMTTTTTNKTETPFLSSFLSKLLETLGGHSSLPLFLSLLQRRSMTPSLSL